jgi:non-heme Fe2+,alpha-ketoglutarate-dependent halogenase
METTIERLPATQDFRLSRTEREQFWRDGYIGPLTIYSPTEMANLWRRMRVALTDRSHAVYSVDALGGVTNISNYDRHLDIDLLSQHITNPKIVDPVTSILGKDVLCWRTEFFPKYPGDEGTDWHQADTFANASGKPQILWPGESEQRFGKGTITVWTAFTDSTIENGCLQIMPGTHNKMNYDETKRMSYNASLINEAEKKGVKRGFFGYDYRQLQVDPDWSPNESQAVPVVMKAGQCLIFWSRLMHASYPNTSEKDYRMGFAARYVPTDVHVYPNTDVVSEYGAEISLEKFGCVVVSGRNKHPENRIVTANTRGFAFPTR